MTLEDRVTAIVLSYAQDVPTGQRPLDASLSLRGDLAIDSLSLVSVMVRLGEECGVYDLEAWGGELAKITTIGDLILFGRALTSSVTTGATIGLSATFAAWLSFF